MLNRIIMLIIMIPSLLFSVDFQLSNVAWTDIVDNDGDGFTLSRTLSFDARVSEGTQNTFVKVFFASINETNWFDGPESTPVVVTSDSPQSISIELSNITVGYSIFNFRLEFRDANNYATILHTVEPEDFDALFYQFFEGQANDNFYNGKTYTVTNTNDNGPGSLREVFKSARTESPDNSLIGFNIPKTDKNYDSTKETWTIILDSPLEAINDIGEIMINGFTQPHELNKGPGFPIVIDGRNLSSGSALSISRAENVYITNMQILNFPDYGVELDQVKSGIIFDCIIGTDPVTAPDTRMKAGIYLFNMSQFSIGTVMPGESNYVSNHFVGNMDFGVLLMLCSKITVAMSNFGNNKKMKDFFAPANINVGIQAQNNSFDLDISDNRFFDTGDIAIQLISAKTCTLVNNKINTDATWAGAFGSYKQGINLIAQSEDNVVSNNTIGYCSGAAITIDGDQNRNRLSQNSISRNSSAIQFQNAESFTTDLTRIENNILYGLAGPGFEIEVFGDESDQARVYLGKTIVNNGMEFAFNLDNLPGFPNLTATVTDLDGNTGYLSKPISWKPDLKSATTVTNTLDDGEGSLRAALAAAMQSGTADTIRFNIPKTDPGFNADPGTWNIYLSGPIYITINDLIIDGASQKEFTGDDSNLFGPEIVIDGSLAPNGSGLYFISCNSLTINDLVITNFAENINFNSVSGAGIKHCYLGTDHTGQSAGSTSQNGLMAFDCDNLLVGPDNVISGNSSRGVMIDSCRQIYLQNNMIGIDRTGSAALVNDFESILVQRNSKDVHILHNFIGGTQFGIRLLHANYVNISHNFINTDSSMQKDLGDGAGIIFQQKSNNNQIEFNTIAYCDRGVVIADSSLYNRLNQNIISKNTNGIILNSGGNNEIKAPVLINASETIIEGTAGSGQLVQLFADESNQGKQYLGETMADPSGTFSLPLTVSPTYPWITAIATDSDGNSSSFSFPIGIATSVDGEAKQLTPESFQVSGCYPNPFNPVTSFEVALPNRSMLKIDIYNILGKHVSSLYNRISPAGFYSFAWNGENDSGYTQTSGTYFVRVESQYGIEIQKILLLK